MSNYEGLPSLLMLICLCCVNIFTLIAIWESGGYPPLSIIEHVDIDAFQSRVIADRRLRQLPTFLPRILERAGPASSVHFVFHLHLYVHIG